jgi:hypothetical protein
MARRKHGASNKVASRLQSTPRPRTRQPPARPPAQPQRFSRFVDRPARQQGRIRRGTDLLGRARPGSQHSNKKFSREINAPRAV